MIVELESIRKNNYATYYKWFVEHNNKQDYIMYCSDCGVFEPIDGNFSEMEMIEIKLFIIDNNFFKF